MPAISFLPFLQTVPPATRILTALTVLFTVAALFLSQLAAQNSPVEGIASLHIPWLVMVPGTSWRYPWVLVTAGFVELSVVELIISAITLPLSCRYLERVWGWKELFRFCLIVIVASNVIAFGFSWLIWFVLGQEEALYGLPYHGQSGLQVGFLVAFTQLIPEHQIQLLGKVKLRVKTLPGIYLLASNILVLVFGSSPYMLVQFGFFVAWVYLRFFKLSENGEFRGDRSETFAFQYWFPPPVRPYIGMVANQVFKLAVRFKLVQQWDEPVVYSSLPGPGGARAEAERRRALALKALDARLASAPTIPPSTSPQPPSAPATSSTESQTQGAAVPPALNKTVSSKNVLEGKEEKVKE